MSLIPFFPMNLHDSHSYGKHPVAINIIFLKINFPVTSLAKSGKRKG